MRSKSTYFLRHRSDFVHLMLRMRLLSLEDVSILHDGHGGDAEDEDGEDHRQADAGEAAGDHAG